MREPDAGQGTAPAVNEVPLRRPTYRVRPWHRDYFPVKHVGRFLQAQLAARVHPRTRVIDVGCGEQPLREIVEAGGGRYLGIDVDRSRRSREQVVGSVLDLPLREGCGDIVVCSEVLEHVWGTERAFAELVRVLRPGGVLLLTVPFGYPLHEEPHDFTRVTPHLVHALARRHGLDVEHLERAGHELEVMATVFDHLLIRSLPARPSSLRRGLGVALRAAANFVAVTGGALVGGGLPRSSFLNVLAVLHRPGP